MIGLILVIVIGFVGACVGGPKGLVGAHKLRPGFKEKALK